MGFLKKETRVEPWQTTTITNTVSFGYFIGKPQLHGQCPKLGYMGVPVSILISRGPSGYKGDQLVDRRQYVNKDGYAYYDARQNFTLTTTYAQPSSATYSFDYKAVPATLIISDTPVFPARFRDILVHGMAVDDMIINSSSKARSYAQETKRCTRTISRRWRYGNANPQNM